MGVYNSWARGCDGLGRGAVGSWSRSDYQRVQAENEHGRQRALLQDQIRMGGLRMELWRGVYTGERCSCYKETTQQSDRKCKSCHGGSYVPGYLKFGYETYWMSAVDTDVVLTDVHITNEFKSSKIELDSTAYEGTIESGDKDFTRAIVGSTWDYDVSSFVRLAEYSSVVVQYSLNSGVTWFDISTLPVTNPVSGKIRFRVTLIREALDVFSPLFEIIRARYARVALGTVLGANGEPREGPWILAMRSVPERQYVKSEQGDRPDYTGVAFWTAGLAMFDPNIEVGSDEELLTGPGVVVKLLDGAHAGDMYVVTKWKQSDPFGYIIVQQEFGLRIENPSGPYHLLW